MKRNIRMVVLLTREEQKRLRRAAEEKEKSVSEFVRDRLPTHVTSTSTPSKARA